MVCETCKDRGGYCINSVTECLECGTIVISPNSNSSIFCKDCARKRNICEKCGNPFEKE